MDETIKLALETIKLAKQAIIFVSSRASAEKTAEDIAKYSPILTIHLEKEVLDVASTPTKQCRRLSHTIKKGIAFHHAGLLAKQKEIIEDNFRSGQIKIICATPTLAAGLSMPAYRVIIKSLKRYSGSWGMDWIPVLEYLQMAGRAGRPEYEKVGQAIIIAKDEVEKGEIYERYICGVPEEIYSKLAVEPVLRTYLLALIASGVIRDQKSMLDFFSKTFWAFQFKDMDKLHKTMLKMLDLLQGWQFITQTKPTLPNSASPPDFMSASLYGKQEQQENNLRATPLGKKVSQLYLDPLTAHHLLDCLAKFDDSKNTFSLLQAICHTLEMRPLLQVKSKEHDIIQEELNKRYGQLLEHEPNIYDPEYPEFIASVKTALFFEEWITEKDEDYLLEKYDIRPGEIYVKLETADWLIYSSTELALLTSDHSVAKELAKLRIRVEYGVKEELLTLLKLRGIGRIRARKLHTHGVKNIGNVRAASIQTLAGILGPKLATDVKIQLGQELVSTQKQVEEYSPPR